MLFISGVHYLLPVCTVNCVLTLKALGVDVARSCVGAISAAIVQTADTSTGDAVLTAANKEASNYAMAASSATRVVEVFQPSFVEATRREEAKALMRKFPCVIQMPMADRNLNEIIIAEHLAEEPLDVIRHGLQFRWRKPALEECCQYSRCC
jgi:hypothetical protein